MICKNCGCEINDNVKFCTNCGAKIEPEENYFGSDTTESSEVNDSNDVEIISSENGAYDESLISDNSLQYKKKLFIIPVVIAVLAIFIAVAVLLINFTSARPMREALAANNGDLVNSVYSEAYGNETKIRKYDELIGDKIDEVSSGVNSYSFDEPAEQSGDDAVTDYLQSEYGTLIYNPNGQSIESCISSANSGDWNALKNLLDSKGYYCSGVYEYKTESDYESAIADFSNVIADDSGYDNALTMIGECVDGYIDSTLAAVDESISNGDISGGIELLNSAKSYLDSCGVDSTEIQQKIDETLVTYADSYAQKAEASFKEHDVNGAIGNIEVAMRLQPGNADYKTKYDTYQQYLPFYLYDEDNILYEERNNLGWLENIEFDVERTTNTNKEMKHCIVWDTSNTDDTSYYAEHYNLGGKYDLVTGTLFLSDLQKDNTNECYFEAYGDGKLLFTSSRISAGFLPEDFSFSVSGIQELKIVFKGAGAGYVSNFVAQKDFPE